MANNAQQLLSAAAKGAAYVENKGVGVFQVKRFQDDERLTHGFTTRRGGVSPAPFDSLNLGMTRDEPPKNIDENYHLLCDAYGIEYNELALVNHEHGAKVLRVDASHGGRGIYRKPLPFSDGLVTNDPNVTLVTSHADCSAFFIYDRATRSIGLSHAGWKGMRARIGQRLVESMQNEFGANPLDMTAAIGPCICKECFEVDASLAESFVDEFECPDIACGGKNGKAYVSLEAAAIIQLLDAGVAFSNITLMNHCTFEEKDLFYSYRRDGERTGSMVAFMRLR